MNLFVDYIQPLTEWLQNNPHWSLLITFLISLTESLAIIGSIIPGSVTMTAIGIMAGSGIMRVDLTLIAAVLGAVTGDGLSYAIGYYYSDHLVDMWPFKKYPTLFNYGKDFFARHGGKSVFLGRFVGPLRSIIPVIAGIMHMSQWRFFLANFISAIGWSLLYVLPGVFIGAASHELSAESATRLLFLIFILMVSVWLLSIVIKWLLAKINAYLKKNLHHFWLSLKQHPLLFRTINAVTPLNEENHFPTVALLLLTLLCFSAFLVLIFLTLGKTSIALLNTPVHFFMQSLHTDLLEAFFVTCVQMINPLTLTLVFLSALFWFWHHKNPRAIICVASLVGLSLIGALIFNQLIFHPRPAGLLVTLPGSSFLSVSLVVATALYGFLLFYIKAYYSLVTHSLRTFTLFLLGLSGLGLLYLGDYWLTDVFASYACGGTIGLITCLIYRKAHTEIVVTKESSAPILLSLLGVILLTSSLLVYLNFKTLVHNHAPFHKEFTLSEAEWWDQKQSILPLYRLNRIGKKLSLFNIQYLGAIEPLQKTLERYGWVSHTETLFSNIVARINNNTKEVRLPLFAQLYQNKRPQLIMTYSDKQTQLSYELRLWESNYYLSDVKHPLWIGSVHINKPLRKMKNIQSNLNALAYAIPALEEFSFRRINLPPTVTHDVYLPATPLILLIKEVTHH